MKNLRPLSVFLVTWMASLTLASAELPPDAYRQMQKEAKEVLQIQVNQVSSKPLTLMDWSKRVETVQATVKAVTRTSSGVKSGDKITVKYERIIPKSGWVGPSPAPPLEEGKEYSAYLEKGADGVFGLAAKGKSFATVK